MALSGNNILQTVREHLNNNISFTEEDIEPNKEIYKISDLPLDLLFAEELKMVNGNCIICNSAKELTTNLNKLFKENLWDSIFCLDNNLQKILIDSDIPFSQGKEDFINMEAGFTTCEFLIARLGSIMISSKQTSGRRLNIFPPVHIVMGFTSQLVKDLDEALIKIKQKYKDNLPSLISVITGPSRTADIEKTLILGAHGPKKLIVLLLKDN